MGKIRVRFAPSPTGPLHIGGVRTALYNYLFAKKNNGTFILRIEDTDQTRYVPGAEEYIMDSLKWLGLEFDEGPQNGGEFGPYRQSERKDIYAFYAEKLVKMGYAYYAFDTPEELGVWREEMTAQGVHSPKYDFSTRMSMNNSLVIGLDESEKLIAAGTPYVIRIKVPENEIIKFSDLVRGEVSFNSNELDDKVMLKTDGMPTYHMANIVDDHLMEITHVIRGEEWLSSTAHHVLLYRYLCWEDNMPQFAHLPLILKPVGKGKLSKRDGAKFGFPVFPISWESDNPEDSFIGFKEFGFLPEATLNFLALLGWSPGTDQEMFELSDLIKAFTVEKIVKSGARFNIDKAKWFNQQYILSKTDSELSEIIKPLVVEKGFDVNSDYLENVCRLMKPRVELLPEIIDNGLFFFTEDFEYQEKMIRKKWKDQNKVHFKAIVEELIGLEKFDKAKLEETIKNYIESNGISFGNIFPLLRIAVTGTTKGPDLFETMEVLGKKIVLSRFAVAFSRFDVIITL